MRLHVRDWDPLSRSVSLKGGPGSSSSQGPQGVLWDLGFQCKPSLHAMALNMKLSTEVFRPTNAPYRCFLVKTLRYKETDKRHSTLRAQQICMTCIQETRAHVNDVYTYMYIYTYTCGPKYLQFMGLHPLIKGVKTTKLQVNRAPGIYIYMGGYQSYGLLLGPLNTRCRIPLRTQNRTIILTTTHIYIYIHTSTPQLPFNRPHIPTNRDHKALNRATLGGLVYIYIYTLYIYIYIIYIYALYIYMHYIYIHIHIYTPRSGGARAL